jgi:GntR family transcriptional regulator
MVSPDNPIPLHLQLKMEIEKKINDGIYIDKIPSERELIEVYRVSRSTVREAVTTLAREGILKKVHGKGTFISLKPIQDWLGNLRSTTETISSMGMIPGAKLIEQCKMSTPDHIRHIIGFDRSYFIKRVRYANQIPIGIEKHYYPIEIGEKLVQFDLNNETLYDLLENELQIKFGDAEQIITSRNITTIEAEYLNVSNKTNVLMAERIISDINNTVIEYEEACYRSDMYSFRIGFSRKNNS